MSIRIPKTPKEIIKDLIEKLQLIDITLNFGDKEQKEADEVYDKAYKEIDAYYNDLQQQLDWWQGLVKEFKPEDSSLKEYIIRLQKAYKSKVNEVRVEDYPDREVSYRVMRDINKKLDDFYKEG